MKMVVGPGREAVVVGVRVKFLGRMRPVGRLSESVIEGKAEDAKIVRAVKSDIMTNKLCNDWESPRVWWWDLVYETVAFFALYFRYVVVAMGVYQDNSTPLLPFSWVDICSNAGYITVSRDTQS